jgi:pantoate--beta-alanine ligase
MHICKTIDDFRVFRNIMDGSLGLVPTMGYLHEGHLSLVRASVEQNDFTAASLFVNPTQFNNPQDLERYPRDKARDLKLFEENGVDLLLIPSADEMYPSGFQTRIEVEKIAQGLEGEHRPGHFIGVATVVAKLFNIVQADRAYFGQKDAQQVAVIRRMTADLNMPIQIVVCPTVRESDGLAMSSRNARLSPEERQAAPAVFRALQAAKSRYDAGERHPETLREAMKQILADEPLARVDYISAADAETLQELDAPSERPILLSLAVFFGETRLIDNLTLG